MVIFNFCSLMPSKMNSKDDVMHLVRFSDLLTKAKGRPNIKALYEEEKM